MGGGKVEDLSLAAVHNVQYLKDHMKLLYKKIHNPRNNA
jgi:hypothetical protein